MTPAEEARFIALWTQEASYREIAQALGCALGTVGTLAAALVAQGKIQARPRGGAYPRQKALARRDDTPHPRGTRDHHGGGPRTTGVDQPLQRVRGAGGGPGERHPRGHPHPTRARGHPRPPRRSTSSSGPYASPRR
jgi:DNA-binding transcriptional MocR family regulator